MNPAMSFDQLRLSRRHRAVGLGLVVVLHLALAWLVLSGTAYRVVEMVRWPVQVTIISETGLPTPPPATPPRVDMAASPRQAEPMHARSPLSQQESTAKQQPAAPAAAAAAGAAPAINVEAMKAEPTGPERVSTPQVPEPAATLAAPPRVAAPMAPRAGNAAPSRLQSSATVQIRDLCPTMVEAVPPARAVKAGIGGTVLARATIMRGKVVQVTILNSEPAGLFDKAVREAMRQYVCHDQGDTEVFADKSFRFRVVE